ncbi:hypothetical protein H6CHR_01706 [Variovorax sp. PBL-H6]|uniref:hypothetical protein n=1 Tax=Variovorax sp. PBL-H6 TaxID=434009 RepID=UPI0013195DFF|nr:hypothetical protein [Variovorax sp. PBL-H6]VTU22020.1 hypothetical protein H6CHR_01706 [Variovorax sp. PBL-H6]
MNKLAPTLLLCLVAGCSSTTPNYDARFGDAVRDAKRNMTINPAAGKTADPVTGMDGVSARESMLLYQGTYRAPPPAVNVINIGGAIGGSK